MRSVMTPRSVAVKFTFHDVSGFDSHWGTGQKRAWLLCFTPLGSVVWVFMRSNLGSCLVSTKLMMLVPDNRRLIGDALVNEE